MESHIVRQPIIDRNQSALGYEILYQEERLDDMSRDASAADAIESFLLQMDSEKFLEGKMVFLTFTRKLLVKNVPRIFSKQKLVIQVSDDILVNPLTYQLILKFKKQGFRIALTDFEFSPRYFGVMDVVDYIKVNFNDLNNSSLEHIVQIGTTFGKTIIGYNINNQEAYDKAVACGCEFMQGSYVAEQLPSTIHKMQHIQSNFFLLMVAITKDDPDLDEIEQLISRDVTLTFSLLRLVNSAYFALRERAKSVKQALVILGLGQLKQWIYLLSFKQDDGNMPDELIKISFLRANFCSELLVYATNMPISKSEAYLMGMFSTLGKLMQIPLEDALGNLSISESIKDALLRREGRCGELFSLVLCYEQANWKGMSAHADVLDIPLNVITQTYFECVEYVNITWQSLMNQNEATSTEN